MKQKQQTKPYKKEKEKTTKNTQRKSRKIYTKQNGLGLPASPKKTNIT